MACFSKAFKEFEEVLKSDEPILITGKVKSGRSMDDNANPDGEAVKATKELNMSEAVPLAKLRSEKTRQMMVDLPADMLTEERVEQLKTALQGSPGQVQTVLRFKLPMRSVTDCVLPSSFNVNPTDDLLLRIERLFGDNAARLR